MEMEVMRRVFPGFGRVLTCLVDYNRFQEPPETPAHRFMLGALRTAVLGTPGPPRAEPPAPSEPEPSYQPQAQSQFQPLQPIQKQQKPEIKIERALETPSQLKTQSSNNSRLEDAEDMPKFSTDRFQRRRGKAVDDEFLITGSSTPPLRRTASGTNLSPTKKGILMTPGTVRAKKSVAWCPSTPGPAGEEKKEVNNRTGIPDDCPGKFPSPWAPRTKGGPDVMEIDTPTSVKDDSNTQIMALKEWSGGAAEESKAKKTTSFGIGKSWLGATEEKAESKRTFNSLDSKSGFKPLPDSGVSDARTKRLQTRVDELQDELRSLKRKTRDYDRLKAQAERLTEYNTKALDTIDELERNNDTLAKGLREAEKSISEYKQRVKELEKHTKEHDQKMNELSTLFNESGIHEGLNPISGSGDLKAELRAAKRSLQSMERLKRENDDLKKRMEDLSKNVEKLKGEKASMQADMAQMLSGTANKAAEKALRAENERLMEENHRLRMENLDKEKKIRQADRTINSLQEQSRMTEKSITQKTTKSFNLDDDPFLSALDKSSSKVPPRKEYSRMLPSSEAGDETAIKVGSLREKGKFGDLGRTSQDLRPRNLHTDLDLIFSPVRNDEPRSPLRRSPRRHSSSNLTGKSPARSPRRASAPKDGETLDLIDFNSLTTSTPQKSKPPPKFTFSLDSDKENENDRPYAIPSPKRSVLPMAYSPGTGVGTSTSARKYTRTAPSPAKRGARATTTRTSLGTTSRRVSSIESDVGGLADRTMTAKARVEARRRERAAARGKF